MTIRVLHCITSLYPDGAQNMLLKLCRHGNREVVDHSVVSLLADSSQSISGGLREAEIPCTSLNMRRALPSAAALLALRKHIREAKPDVVQGWLYHGNLAALAAVGAAGSHGKLAWNIRQSLHDLANEKLSTRLAVKLGALLSQRPQAIIYNSELSARLHKAYGYHGRQVEVIANGFDLRRFAPSAEAYRTLRNSLDLAPDTPIVGIVGRYHHYKGHDVFLKAAGIVAESDPRVHFVMVGRDLVATNAGLAELIARPSLQGRLHLLGQRSDVPELMPGFDIFCLSSRTEGFPNVIGEAMACAVPCIATDVGGCREVLAGLGTLVPPNDPRGLADAIAAMLRQPPEERRELGSQLRQRALDHYSIERIVDHYQRFYFGLCR